MWGKITVEVKIVLIEEASAWESVLQTVAREKKMLEWNLHLINGIQRE